MDRDIEMRAREDAQRLYKLASSALRFAASRSAISAADERAILAALSASPLPGREEIARCMYERFAGENGGFYSEEDGCGFGSWEDLPDKTMWLSAAGYLLSLSTPPTEG